MTKYLKICMLLGCLAYILETINLYPFVAPGNAIFIILFYGAVVILLIIQLASEIKIGKIKKTKPIKTIKKKKHKKRKWWKKEKAQIIEYNKYHDQYQAMWDELNK